MPDTQPEIKYKIILVDDDDFLTDMYATKFSHSGVSVDVCKSGEIFLEKLKGGAKPDLILLDIIMPKMTGIEVLRKVREEKLAEDIPIVMLTNQNDEKDISETKKLGVACYIVKAVATPSEVVNEVLKIIQTSKP
jgi:CheY-like chemotaxis protein